MEFFRKAVDIANDVFGFDKWTSTVESLEIQYQSEQNGRWSVGCKAVVRVVLKNGNSHTGI